MINRLTTAVAAAALAIGLLTGAAGAIIVANATADGPVNGHEKMGAMTEMMEMMGGSMMRGAGEISRGSSQHGAHHSSTNR